VSIDPRTGEWKALHVRRDLDHGQQSICDAQRDLLTHETTQAHSYRTILVDKVTGRTLNAFIKFVSKVIKVIWQMVASRIQLRFHAGAGRGRGHRPYKSYVAKPTKNLAGPKIVPRPPNLAVLLTQCGQLILRKISKFNATRCKILRLRCTKFDFRCDLAGSAYSGTYRQLCFGNLPSCHLLQASLYVYTYDYTRVSTSGFSSRVYTSMQPCAWR